MTSSIPDAFSTEELQRMLAEAQPEPEVTTDPDLQSQEYICEIAQEAIDLACAKSSGPMVHKVMLFQILSNFVEWHNKVAKNKFEDGEFDCGAAWLRDAGKFQACMNILSNVTVGPDDFTCE